MFKQIFLHHKRFSPAGKKKYNNNKNKYKRNKRNIFF